LDLVREVVASNPVAPTVFRTKPFGKFVEELSHWKDGICDSKIEFNTHSEMVRCSESIDATSIAVKRLAVQILSPVSTVVR
jgi:hypothetical protein